MSEFRLKLTCRNSYLQLHKQSKDCQERQKLAALQGQQMLLKPPVLTIFVTFQVWQRLHNITGNIIDNKHCSNQ